MHSPPYPAAVLRDGVLAGTEFEANDGAIAGRETHGTAVVTERDVGDVRSDVDLDSGPGIAAVLRSKDGSAIAGNPYSLSGHVEDDTTQRVLRVEGDAVPGGEGEHLFVQATGQGQSRLFSQGGGEFRADFDNSVRIQFDAGEPAPSLTLFQGGAQIRGPRKTDG